MHYLLISWVVSDNKLHFSKKKENLTFFSYSYTFSNFFICIFNKKTTQHKVLVIKTVGLRVLFRIYLRLTSCAPPISPFALKAIIINFLFIYFINCNRYYNYLKSNTSILSVSKTNMVNKQPNNWSLDLSLDLYWNHLRWETLYY